MKPVTFIHCADLHLDSPLVGLKNFPDHIYEIIRESTLQSFTKIVDEAINRQVDFLIIAGDLYDGEDRSIRAQIYFQKEMEKLEAAQIPVFIVHGNHDHLGGNWTRISNPENVHIFSKDVECKQIETKNGSKVHLYGFSYPQKHVDTAPLQFYEKKEGADYHIGILHGHDQQNENHYSYASFHVNDLLACEFDYWALGHIHKTSILHKNPYIVYPGNIQGRHKKESGEKGCYYVKLQQTDTNLQFIPTALVEWDYVNLPKETIFNNFEELYRSCLKVKEEYRIRDRNYLLQFSINENQLGDHLLKQFSKDDLLYLLQEGEEHQKNFVWIYNLVIIETEKHVKVEGPFFEELHEMLENVNDLSDSLSLLYRNSKTRRYLDEFTSEDERKIKHEAEKLLYELLKGR